MTLTLTTDDLAQIALRLGLPIPEAYRAGVLANFDRLLDQAQLVMALELPPVAAPKPEFEP